MGARAAESSQLKPLEIPAAPGSLTNDQIDLWDALCKRVMVLNERAWEGRVTGAGLAAWLKNFNGLTGEDEAIEQLHALYLISQFMFFGGREIRVLLRAMFRDMFLIPLVQKLRHEHANVDEERFLALVKTEIDATKFVGVGNPSESGVHLLYFFRQENELSKHNFIDSAQLYVRQKRFWWWTKKLRYPEVKRYIFLDDICGTGETALRYSENLLPEAIRSQPNLELWYFSLFACREGMDIVRQKTIFGQRCGAIFELDATYKATSENSRYSAVKPEEIRQEIVETVVSAYGSKVWKDHPLGYLDGQLLLGFAHNTPDNTLPIIWSDLANGADMPWTPIFKRYPKL